MGYNLRPQPTHPFAVSLQVSRSSIHVVSFASGRLAFISPKMWRNGTVVVMFMQCMITDPAEAEGALLLKDDKATRHVPIS